MRKLFETSGSESALSNEIAKETQRFERLKRVTQNGLEVARSHGGLVRPIAHLLEEFRDELALRFTLENAVGVLQKSVEDAPRLFPKIDGLRQDQAALYTEMCEIAESILRCCDEGREYVPRDLPDRWGQLLERLRQYDEAQRDLINEALLLDIGVGD